MTDNELKELIGKNIAYFRTKIGMRQSELANELNYSDKSISKWECGDGIPDIIVLKKMSEIFGVTVNDFFTLEHKNYTPDIQKKHIMIPIISVCLCWFVASVLFGLMKIILSYFPVSFLVPWLWFVWAVPVSAIIFLVFSKIWWNRITTAIFVSALDWTLVIAAHLTLTYAYPIKNIELIYIAAAFFQLLTILWFIMKGKRQAQMIEYEKS